MRDYQEKDIPTVKSLDGLIRLLQREGARHRSLYHYTRWDAFAKMMRPVETGACVGHRMMLLSSYLQALREIAASSNDGWKQRILHVRKYGG